MAPRFSAAPLYPFPERNRLMGFEDVRRFDAEHQKP
jgi:hypothetical protein